MLECMAMRMSAADVTTQEEHSGGGCGTRGERREQPICAMKGSMSLEQVQVQVQQMQSSSRAKGLRKSAAVAGNDDARVLVCHRDSARCCAVLNLPQLQVACAVPAPVPRAFGGCQCGGAQRNALRGQLISLARCSEGGGRCRVVGGRGSSK